MKLAFSLIVHKFPEQVIALAKAVGHNGNYCLIHCNKRSGPEFRATVGRGLAGLPNVRFLESMPVNWGSGSILQVQLAAFRSLVQWADDWTHVVNLSGQCLPTQPMAQIQDYLFSNAGKSFLEVIDLEAERPDLSYRFTRYHVDIGGKLRNTRIPRRRPTAFKLSFGAFWGIISREGCDYIANAPAAAEILRYLRYVMYPDELAFQTILMNGPLRATVVPRVHRLMMYEGGSPNPIVLSMREWETVTAPHVLFARKFDPAVEPAIVARIGERIGCDLFTERRQHA